MLTFRPRLKPSSNGLSNKFIVQPMSIEYIQRHKLIDTKALPISNATTSEVGKSSTSLLGWG